MDKKLEKMLIDGADALGLKLDKNEVKLYFRYMQLLLEWNKRFNLTAIEDPEEIVVKHFVDSIAPLPCFKGNKYKKLIDIGTGAGFPGVPLKIAHPDFAVVLLDSLQKRIYFLRNVVEQLKLDSVTVHHGRAEDYGKMRVFRENFDIAVSRAVSRLTVLVELCLPFVKVNGIFLAYKGPNVDKEIKEAEKAITILGGKILENREIILPGLDEGRNIVIIEKSAPTPEKYPRKAGLPEKRPLY